MENRLMNRGAWPGSRGGNRDGWGWGGHEGEKERVGCMERGRE